jgi:dihydroorotate dehydrogenase (fumarate)
LRNGIEHIRKIETDMCEWMGEHDYESVRQLQGSMSQKYCSDPAAFERSQYMRAVLSYKSA